MLSTKEWKFFLGEKSDRKLYPQRGFQGGEAHT